MDSPLSDQREVLNMARRCEICGKGPMSGHKISHAHNVSNRRFLPNIQKVKVRLPNGGVKTMKVCAKCLKAGKVAKA